MTKCEVKPKGHTRVQWAVAFTVNTTLMTFGLQSGWLSPVVKILTSPESPAGRPLTDTEISLIAAIPAITAILGIFIFLYIVDNFGRKWAIMLIASFQIMCWIPTIYPADYVSILIGRVFSGLGSGGCFHIVPMYIKEISQNNIRGTLGTILTLFQYLGILLIYSLGGYLNYNTVLYIVVALPVVTILSVLKVPESPSYLIKTGKIQDAAANIAFLRGLDVNDKEVKDEVDSIKREDDYFKSIPNISLMNIFKVKAWRRGFITLSLICFIRALNGIFAVISYASVIFVKTDENISPELLSLTIPIFMTIGALITMSCVDKFGRRWLLAINFTISALAFFVFATAILLCDYGWSTPGWFSAVALLLAVLCYGCGVAPIPFIIMAEMFNFQIRAKLMAGLNIFSWFLSFLQLFFFPAISNSLGAHTAFYIFGAINMIGTIIAIVLLPETANKSVEEIEAELCNKNKRGAKRVIC